MKGTVRVRPWFAVGVAVLLVVGGLLAVVALNGAALGARPSSGSAPPWPGLAEVPAVYDASDGYDLWYFPHGSTWTYAHGVWSNITSTAGVPRNMEGNVQMAYDARDGYVLLFGGEVSALPPVLLADTWAFHAGVWTNLTSQGGTAPPAGYVGLMTFDTADRAVLLFGGARTSHVASNQTWTYAAGSWSNVTVPAPPPVQAAGGLSELVDLVDDPADGYVLFYSAIGRCAQPCSLSWEYRGGVWTNLTSTTTPDPLLRLIDLFAYDSTAGFLVALAFCLSTPAYACQHSFGTFMFRGGAWSDITPATNPSPRIFSSWVDDPSDGGVILVGGCCWGDFSGLSLLWQDVWIYAYGVWTEFEPWGGGAPSLWENGGFWLAAAVLSVGVAAVAVASRVRPAPPS